MSFYFECQSIIKISKFDYVLIQGSHIKIKTNVEIPVQVDGEPWLQPPGDIVVLKSALRVRNIHIFISILLVVMIKSFLVCTIFRTIFVYPKTFVEVQCFLIILRFNDFQHTYLMF